jgi:hypothetical protein
MTDEFEGFQEPEENWSKLPHQLIGALPLIETVSEMKVILYVLRHTWGFREFDKLKRITLDEFQNGRKKKDGSRMDAGTGLSANAIKDGIARAINHGFLIQVPDGRDFGRSSHVYQLRVSNSDTVSSPDTQASKVDTQASKVDTRSEKDTCERNPGKKKDTSPSGEKLAEPVAEKTEVDPSAMPVPGDDNGASNDANRAHGAPEKGGDGAASTMTTGGAGCGDPAQSAGQRPDTKGGDAHGQSVSPKNSETGGRVGGKGNVDYLQHCAQCAEAQQHEGAWSTPNGTDALVEMAITCFCGGNGPRRDSGTWYDMANTIKPVHADWGLHEEEPDKAVAIVRAAIALFLKEKPQMVVYKYPSFAANYGSYLSRIMNGDNGQKGAQHEQPHTQKRRRPDQWDQPLI